MSRPGRNPLALSYDAAGRLLSVASATIDTRWTYDQSTGLVARLASGSATTGQRYDLQYDGRLPTFITASGLVNGRVEYQYTVDGWLRSVGIAGRALITYDYDPDGLVTRGGQLRLTRDPSTGAITGDTIGVVATSRTYDDHGALASITLRVAGVPTWIQQLTRDSLGRITAQRDSDATTGAVVTGYHYDAQDRLDRVTTNGVVAQAFDFNAAGNRTTVTTSAGTVAATYAADDRILSYDGQAITHDASGARSQEVRGADTLGYQYDDLGRMTQLTSTTAGALSFRYDAQGRRVEERRNGTVTRAFLYGGSQAPIAELTAAGTVRSEFVNVTGGVAPDYIIQGATTYYVLQDQLGSVRLVLDVGSGGIAQAVDYDANGVVTRNTAPNLQPFGYAGGLNDSDGRTVHFGARDYDARTARWLQVDPIGARGGKNRYDYGANNPVNAIDPSGLWPVISLGGTIAWIAGKGGSLSGGVILFSDEGPGLFSTAGTAEGIGGGLSGDLTFSQNMNAFNGPSDMVCMGPAIGSACFSNNSSGSGLSLSGGYRGAPALPLTFTIGQTTTTKLTCADVRDAIFNWAKPGLHILSGRP